MKFGGHQTTAEKNICELENINRNYPRIKYRGKKMEEKTHTEKTRPLVNCVII